MHAKVREREVSKQNSENRTSGPYEFLVTLVKAAGTLVAGVQWARAFGASEEDRRSPQERKRGSSRMLDGRNCSYERTNRMAYFNIKSPRIFGLFKDQCFLTRSETLTRTPDLRIRVVDSHFESYGSVHVVYGWAAGATVWLNSSGWSVGRAGASSGHQAGPGELGGLAQALGHQLNLKETFSLSEILHRQQRLQANNRSLTPRSILNKVLLQGFDPAEWVAPVAPLELIIWSCAIEGKIVPMKRGQVLNCQSRFARQCDVIGCTFPSLLPFHDVTDFRVPFRI